MRLVSTVLVMMTIALMLLDLPECRLRVRSGKAQNEQMFSGLPPERWGNRPTRRAIP